MNTHNSDSIYNKRGVSSSKTDVHKAIKNLDKGLFPNSFCKINEDVLTNDDSHCLCMHADGAGSKSALAYAYWKHSGDISVWAGIAQDAIVMNTDDLLCVGIIDNIILSSTIARNKHLITQEVLSEIINSTNTLIQKINKISNANIVLSGGETADLGDIAKTIIVDSTAIGRAKKEDIVNINIRPGDVIVGLASSGQATYETDYNSGIGSNGLTAARHDIFNKTLAQNYPETFDSNTDPSFIYSGNTTLDDTINIPKYGLLNIAKLLLSPTRTYLPIIKKIINNNLKEKINGIIHCTGGGQSKVLHFINKGKVIKNNLFSLPPIFELIKKEGKTPIKEMYQVFNMGHRMEIYTNKDTAIEIISIAKTFNIDAQIIGTVEPSDKAELVIEDEGQKFSYVK